MWSYNVAGSRSWAPVAGAPRPAAPTGSPIGAELSDANHSIPRSPRAPPVEVWAGVFKSGGGGGAGGGGFRLDDCLRELGLGTGTAGARSASSGVASQRPAAKRFDESWAATCARRRRQQGHCEVQVSSAGCLGTLDFVSPSPSPSPHASRPHALSPHPHAMPTHPHTLTPSHPHASPSHPRPRGSPSLHTPRRQRDSPHTLTGSSERRRGPPWTSPSSRRCRRYASGPSPSPAPSRSPGLTSSPSPSPSNSPLGPAEGQPVWALAGRAPGAQGEGEFAASPPHARCSNDRA